MTSSWARRATSSVAGASSGGRGPGDGRRGGRLAWRSALACIACVACAACGAAPGSAAAGPGVSTATTSPPLSFEFDSLDDRPVSAEATRGKPTVLAFVTTGSLPAQAQVDFLVAMARNDGGHTNYAIVALDPRENRELVELYGKTLHVPFPVAMADDVLRSGAGPFGDVTAVPVTVVLDRVGRVVARIAGRVAKSEELRASLAGL